MISRPYQYIFVSISMYNVSDQRRSLCHEEYLQEYKHRMKGEHFPSEACTGSNGT